ncbi:intraflagellar transport-associated protein isoform X2 [Engystomops pustulosus]|uniref:intraflagellar transport-associated protein isoform X2 n=1 Tax=Engystomops pustulosus TaxID=76066 RepID=UPI003AFA64BE
MAGISMSSCLIGRCIGGRSGLGAHQQECEDMFDGSQVQKSQITQGTQDTTDVGINQDEPKQLTLDEGITVGNCHSLTYSGRVQVDNYFNSSDIDSDNDETSPSVLLFPGEANLDPGADGGMKLIVRSTCLQSHTSSGTESSAEEHLGDEIQSFSLDRSFDYDNVALTSKFSEEEMNFLRRQVEQTAGKT